MSNLLVYQKNQDQSQCLQKFYLQIPRPPDHPFAHLPPNTKPPVISVPISKPPILPGNIHIPGGGLGKAPIVGIPGGQQTVIDWQAFFNETKYPSIGYDPIYDKIIIKKGNDYSADNDQDFLVYDMLTGSWALVKAGIANTVDTTNFVVNGDDELVLKQGGTSDSNDDFFRWQDTPQATSTFKWQSKAFDLGSPTVKKKLYQVIVHAISGANAIVKVSYDNATTTSDIFVSNTLSDNAYITRNELTVSSFTAFTYISVEISASGGSVATDFAISDISFIYRPLGAR